MRIIAIFLASLLCASCGHFNQNYEWEPYDCEANKDNITCKAKQEINEIF